MKNTLITCLRWALMLTLVLMPSLAWSQGRDYIRQQIKFNGARNVAITKTNGDLMLYGRNGTASSGIPNDLSQALHELNENGEYIDDVQLTEQGRWLILFGNNGFRWNDIPYPLEQKLREYNNNNEVVTSVTFNDAGDWIIISTDHYSASDSRLMEWMKEGSDKYGMVWSACITDDALVVVYQTGFRTLGEVPKGLSKALKKTNFNVYRLKIAGTAWFFSDGKQYYNYNM